MSRPQSQQTTELLGRLKLTPEEWGAIEAFVWRLRGVTEAERKLQGGSNTPGRTNTRGSANAPDPYHQGRRSAFRELRASGGLGEGQYALEVLYLLPDGFIRAYERLFHLALLGADSAAVSGVGGGIEKARGITGTVLGEVSRAQAQGTGKRYKEPRTTMGGQRYVELKGEIDQVLVRVGRRIQDRVTKAGEEGYWDGGGWAGTPRSTRTQKERSGKAGSVKGRQTLRCQGRVEGRNGEMRGCGRFMKDEWGFCPSCGTKKEKKTGN